MGTAKKKPVLTYINHKNTIFQEQSSFAKSCRKKGGFFKCCIKTFALNIYETSRNSLIEEGLIKDKPTYWCLPDSQRGSKKKDPCWPCTTDAMCTERDIRTNETRNTFIKKYKKEHRVTR